MSRKQNSRGTVAFTGLLVSLALGSLALKGLHEPVEVGAESAVTLATTRSIQDVDRYSKVAKFESGRQVRVRLLSGEGGEVIVLAQELQIGVQSFEHIREITRLRADQSWEPIVFNTDQGAAICILEPETTWGGVHRETGLGMNIRFEPR